MRKLLKGELDRRSTSAGTAGWAPLHTAAVDEAMRPGLGLVDCACGLEPTVVSGRVETGGLPGRPIYRPLLVYAVASVRRRRGMLSEEWARWAEGARRVGPTGGVALGAWWALASGVAAVGEFGGVRELDELVAGQRASGEFMDSSPYDSPDLHWYDELVVLHALTSYAALMPAGDERGAVLNAVRRAAEFHLAETQPDHATSQPWAVHAFALREETYPLAELLLHGAMAQNVGRLDAVGQILLADGVLALMELESRRQP